MYEGMNENTRTAAKEGKTLIFRSNFMFYHVTDVKCCNAELETKEDFVARNGARFKLLVRVHETPFHS